MLTGTPLDLTPYGSVFRGFLVLYWVAAVVLVVLALWWFKRWWLKLGVAAAIAAAFIVPVVRHAQERQTQHDAAKARLDKAMAHFQMRCKSAGEKITRTVENVEGVVWMKWRPKVANVDSQFSMDDPYGRNCGGEDCILLMLRLSTDSERFKEESTRRRDRYRFVESIDPAEGKRHRYTGAMKPAASWSQEAIDAHRKRTNQDTPSYGHQFALERRQIEDFTARYGVTWDDISKREDREMWIAGGSLKVVDLQTNEVIAERVGYMIDRGQGSRAGFRSPWLFAEYTACPQFEKKGDSLSKWARTNGFIFSVLKPIREQ